MAKQICNYSKCKRIARWNDRCLKHEQCRWCDELKIDGEKYCETHFKLKNFIIHIIKENIKSFALGDDIID